jgi:hypothetical protein
MEYTMRDLSFPLVFVVNIDETVSAEVCLICKDH